MSNDILLFYASIVSSAGVLVTVIIMAIQIKEMRRATYATAFKAIYDMLQSENIRDARRIVLLQLSNKPLSEWTDDELRAAELVCSTYDSVAIMAKNEMIPVHVIVDNWGDSIYRSWKVLYPLIRQYRENRAANEFWDDYEWLVSQTKKYTSQ